MKVNIGPYRKNRAERVIIEPHDTYSMDHTLALIILPMLKQLKKTKHGSPNVKDEDVPEELRSTNAAPIENTWDIDELWHQRWDYVLDEMIWAFGQKVKHIDPLDQCHDKCANFGDPVCKSCLDETQQRMTAAFKLFGEYYEELWD